ncbi:cholinephosphotransferase [Ephemerocybe angulata]|uniref:diacylglycerol cholinephosphotransferase n=1 Tax=Ephemerocybe angulata TaxID=980116 RepID=A0A8H6M3G4_9AGAR|nr:cholinephosphotransferase [Tulosesus angulatus]
MGYIPEHMLENLKNYKYRGADKSLVSRFVLNPFWNWLVTLWPLSVAPNTITLTGLSIVFFNFATLLYYDPLYLVERDGYSDPPRWVYFSWGVGLFVYQSLDAIDGKQARRTGMAGPLGEMFDHGCDALNTTLECILASRALGLGRSWWTVASQIATLANFYLTTWEEYHTGILYLGYFSGPVEGILMIVAIYFITGAYGPQVWENRIWTTLHLENVPYISRLPNIPLNEAFMVFGAVGLGFNIITSYINVLRATRQSHAKGGNNNLTARHDSNYPPLLLLLPFVVSTAIQVAWLSHPEFNHSWILHSASFVPFMCAWGLQFAHQVGRMILAHVTGTGFPVWDWVWVWSLLGAVDANLPSLLGRAPVFQTSTRNTAIFVWVTLAISLLTYARFVTLVINDITNYLGIACFTVRKKDERGVWRRVGEEKVL